MQDPSITEGAPRSTGRVGLLAIAPAGVAAAAGACAGACGVACASGAASVLGLGGVAASLGSWAPLIQPIAYALTAVFLGLAFYRAYRRGGPRDRRRTWMLAGVAVAILVLPRLWTSRGEPCKQTCPSNAQPSGSAARPPCGGS